MDASNVQNRISDFMSRTFLFQFGNGVGPDTDLFQAGLVDSFGFIELVGFLESTFAVKLTDDDLASPETATLAGTTRLIVSRMSK
jgi:acyl carrier protein